jgi:NTE family protein
VGTALVLSAGGLYAAWEVGVWKALHALPGVQPDMVVGASAGALNGWAIAGGCTVEELEREWLEPRMAGIMQPGLHRSGVLRPATLYQKTRDLHARFHPRLPFALTLVEVPRFRTHLVRGREITWQHLAATCSIPFGFPPVRIGGVSYVDGGLAGALPLWAAEALGATRAIALNALTAWPFITLRKVLPLRRPSSALRVIAIEPSEPLGPLRHAVRWSARNIERWIELGERDGNRAATSITM